MGGRQSPFLIQARKYSSKLFKAHFFIKKIFPPMSFSKTIRPYVSYEVELAKTERLMNRPLSEFAFLERAHVLGQASTIQHVRTHVLMLAWAIRNRKAAEFFGQLIRIVGAVTKTAIGLVPPGNTGGSNVSPFMPLTIPADLLEILKTASSDAKSNP